MDENLIHNEIQLTKKEKIVNFYKKNKILIFSSLSLIFIIVVIIIFYLELQEKKKNLIAQNYVSAKLYLEKNERTKAKNILKEIVFSDNDIYSSLSFFIIL